MLRRKLAVGAACLAILPACRSQEAAKIAAEPSSVVRVDAATGRVLQVHKVGPDPLQLTASGDAVWALSFGDGSISRVDRSGARKIDVGEAVGIGSSDDVLWAAVDGNVLTRIDETGKVASRFSLGDAALFAPRDAGFIGVGHDSVWVTVPVLGDPSKPHSLWRVDIVSGRTVTQIPIGLDPLTPLVEEAIWIVHPPEGRVTRVDPSTHAAESIPVGRIPIAAAAGAGSVWVADEGGELIRLDGSGKVIDTLDLDVALRGVTVAGSTVWLTTISGVLGVDASTGKVTRRFDLVQPKRDEGPIGIAVVDGDLWVSIE